MNLYFNKNAITVLVLLCVVLLACKEAKPDKKKPVAAPSKTPSEIIKSGKELEGKTVRVRGKIVDYGGGTAMKCFGLKSGKSEVVRACMKQYHCINGVCAKDAPSEGSNATLKCKLIMVNDMPFLKQCERVK